MYKQFLCSECVHHRREFHCQRDDLCCGVWCRVSVPGVMPGSNLSLYIVNDQVAKRLGVLPVGLSPRKHDITSNLCKNNNMAMSNKSKIRCHSRLAFALTSSTVEAIDNLPVDGSFTTLYTSEKNFFSYLWKLYRVKYVCRKLWGSYCMQCSR